MGPSRYFVVFAFSVLLLLASDAAVAQGIISTAAGDSVVRENVPALQARFSTLRGLVVDSRGVAYIGESLVRKVDPATGLISTVSPTGVLAIAPDRQDNLILWTGTKLLRLALGTGAVTPISLGGLMLPLPSIIGLATDSGGNIYITEESSGNIYRIDANSNALTTFAGIGSDGRTQPLQGDGGPATLAALALPGAITVDVFGNVFFAEQYRLRRIDGKTGIITNLAPLSVAGTGTFGDGGSYSKAGFTLISAITTDSKGNLYIADVSHVRKIDWSTGIISAVAGSGSGAYAGDGMPALQANFGSIAALTVEAPGNLWIADQGNARVFVVLLASGLIKTVAGTALNGDGGPALGALLPDAAGLVANSQGDLYTIAGGFRRIDHTTGLISTLPFGQKELASEVYEKQSTPLTLDAAGNILLSGRTTVRRFDAATGSVTVVAGTTLGQIGGLPVGDGGAATDAPIQPSATAVDSSGNVYIADRANFRIRRVNPATGIISTVAGNGGADFSGVTGPATQISIGTPLTIAIAPNGEIYWATLSYILKLSSDGMLSIAAGNGGCIYAGDGGDAHLASLCGISALAFDRAGNLFVSELFSGTVRRIEAATGIIQTLAGTGGRGSSSDGLPATQATLLNPGAIALVGETLYLIETPDNNEPTSRIRAVTPAVPPPLPQPPGITSISNAVDFRAIFSPGSIFSVFGNYLGPQSTFSGQIGPSGNLSTSLAGDQVKIDGIPSPVLYVSAGQINAVFPYATRTGSASFQVATTAGAITMDGFSVTPTSLSVFDGLVFNEDGTRNSAGNPARKGSTLVLYGTGMGQTSPALLDGSMVQGPPWPLPITPFVATVTNASTSYKATIAYLGPLPGFVAGALQANIQLPDTLPAGESNLSIVENTGRLGTIGQKIYVLSDPPVLTGTSPASPIPQTVGNGIALTLTGQGLLTVKTIEIFLGGQPAKLDVRMYAPCTATSCTVVVYFAGKSGPFSATVTNAAGQTSNQFFFVVKPYDPPTVAAIANTVDSAPLVAKSGSQFVAVLGQGFLEPVTVNLYYKGKFVSDGISSGGFASVVNAELIQCFLDFHGTAGDYEIEVVGPNGTSPKFAFTVSPL